MESTITLIWQVQSAADGQLKTFKRRFGNLTESLFCPTEGPYAGYLVFPQDGCPVKNLRLGSGLSISFTAEQVKPDGTNVDITMRRLLVSRNRNELPDLIPQAITEILLHNGWECPECAAV